MCLGIGVLGAFLEGYWGKQFVVQQITEAQLIMHVYFIMPLGWLVPKAESLLILLDVGGHVGVETVDPLKVNLKGDIRKHL